MDTHIGTTSTFTTTWTSRLEPQVCLLSEAALRHIEITTPITESIKWMVDIRRLHMYEKINSSHMQFFFAFLLREFWITRRTFTI